jgi:hypothetical protein
MGPTHHGMAHPQVSDGNKDLLIWKIAPNILKNSREQPTRDDPSALLFGEGIKTHHLKN